MNNIALDVAIGLTFTYLLYSLLATTIKEFIATIFSYRATMLERGIQQMLDGCNIDFKWYEKIYYKIIGKKTLDTKKMKARQKLFATKITSHPIFLRSGENSFGKRPSYLVASAFSDILIDILHEDKTSPVLLKNIQAKINSATLASDGITPELKAILAIYIQQANGDVQRFRWLIENWYNDMMDRVSGWYKRQANWILLYIGFFMAVLFNVSTIDIVSTLSKDKSARDALVQSASAYIQHESYSRDSAKISAGAAGDSNFIKDAKLRLAQIKSLYDNEIATDNGAIGAGWSSFRSKKDSAHQSGINYEKIRYVFGETFKSPRKWIGFLITAFAISLGAPFWFDLLNRFINLRVAGKKPDDNTAPVETKTVLIDKIPDPSPIG